MPDDLVKEPDEKEEDYQERMLRVAAWPKRTASIQASWVRCARIILAALDILQEHDSKGHQLRGCVDGKRYYFDAKVFYEYICICFHQGLSVRVWKSKPMSPTNVQKDQLAAWYLKKARELEREVSAQWLSGKSLDAQFPRYTLDELWGGPEQFHSHKSP